MSSEKPSVRAVQVTTKGEMCAAQQGQISTPTFQDLCKGLSTPPHTSSTPLTFAHVPLTSLLKIPPGICKGRCWAANLHIHFINFNTIKLILKVKSPWQDSLLRYSSTVRALKNASSIYECEKIFFLLTLLILYLPGSHFGVGIGLTPPYLYSAAGGKHHSPLVSKPWPTPPSPQLLHWTSSQRRSSTLQEEILLCSNAFTLSCLILFSTSWKTVEVLTHKEQ